ncbi:MULTISPECIES: prephenate dehydrogenase [Streptomyces]|uniref:Prephenate dehydrogenase n=1 Tax=Streptomyces griseus subsp. griseus (strain JCM 4626 / CBS 651.72 / NBRC 13350 / KCC S-0626 / ISP 5235) TaxID=455632 RepID=B1W220_STRGG|nr:prephenate dehydrogenase [Streptomyces griseus]MBW3708241.1 prephenate dehydrogenase [Streptomyces griseus]BAG22567.1 putative prephenate dehydrogenase [Streptomyces griseus subsp. griseus NBRC 13350]SEE50522.1 prephenate dehydrogenase [Streptomyces griseus]SQA22355.1 prephenate dehydrogenase [Streptomyces griseus]
MRTALVIGTGLVGTSAALALAGRGVQVHLVDHDPASARTAAALGAGTDEAPEGRVDLAVVAVPPAHTAAVLATAMRDGVARGYLDVASVKGGPHRELEALGLDLTPYIGTHPMAGKERSGPLAATADLFEGRPWVLTPTRDTDTEVLNLALELVALCRAVPVVMDADAHDRAVALVSHTPQLISSMVAARLEEADETAVRLCGQGIRDVTRIAASDPRMWVEILSANPGPVADVLAGVAADLAETVTALRGLHSADEEKRRAGAGAIEDVLRRGNAGRVRVPGKHGAAPAAYETVAVLIGDKPGELAAIFADAGRAGVNIEDVRIEHATGQQAGLVQIMVEPSAAPVLGAALQERGWSIRG